ncbi:MAG: hypothetical protein MI810_09920 [Flavobacteriales bacterium]|nr:hypothetical protein [Flavobacteriales bacterium]
MKLLLSLVLFFSCILAFSQQDSIAYLDVPGFKLKSLDAINNPDGSILISGRFDYGSYEAVSSLYGYDPEKYPKWITQNNFFGDPMCFLHKRSANGDSLWTRLYPHHLSGIGITACQDSGFAIVGFRPTNREKQYEYDKTQAAIVIKTDANGNLKWYKDIPSNYNSVGLDIVELNNGEFIVLASKEREKGYGDLSNPSIVRLVKLSTEGEIMWDKHFPEIESGNYTPSRIILDKNGDLVSVGTKKTGSHYSMYLLKLNTDGEAKLYKEYHWLRENERHEWNWGYDVIETANGFVAVSMAYYRKPESQRVIKVDNNFNIVWEQLVECNNTYQGTLGTDVEGNIYFAAPTETRSVKVIKLSAEGQLIWERERTDVEANEVVGTLVNNQHLSIISRRNRITTILKMKAD